MKRTHAIFRALAMPPSLTPPPNEDAAYYAQELSYALELPDDAQDFFETHVVEPELLARLLYRSLAERRNLHVTKAVFAIPLMIGFGMVATPVTIAAAITVTSVAAHTLFWWKHGQAVRCAAQDFNNLKYLAEKGTDGIFKRHMKLVHNGLPHNSAGQVINAGPQNV